MDEQNKGVEPPSPRDLLAAFSGGRIIFWIAAAVLIHVVVIGGLSVGYIRDRWVDPEGAVVRKAAAAAAIQAAKQLEDAKTHPPAVPGKGASTNAASAASASATNSASAAGASSTNRVAATTNAAAKIGNVAVPAGRENTPVVRSLNEVAPSNTLPRQPELGISIEDTNRL